MGAEFAAQPLDSDLTAIAALSTTAYGRSLLASASAVDLRTGIGSAGTARPQDFGLLAWSHHPAIANTGTLLPTAGLVNTVRLAPGAAGSVTSIACIITAGGTSLTNCFAAVYQAGTLALIGVTADQSAVWNSAGYKEMPLSGGPFAYAAGDVIVGFFANTSAGALPTFGRAASAASYVLNLGLSGNNSLWGFADAARTTAPSPLGTITANGTAYFMAIK